MPTLARPHGPLHYEVTGLTAPWHGAPETILFHHGLGITSDIWLEWLAPLADRLLQTPLLAEHRAMRRNHARRLWPQLMLELWAERWNVDIRSHES